MPVSKKRAHAAIDTLLDRGFLVPSQETEYRIYANNRLSYKTFVIRQLGVVFGNLYVREEEAQHRILDSLSHKLVNISVPEALLLEDNLSVEPWHREKFSEKAGYERFEEEAGEPWHISLKGLYTPDKSVLAYFSNRTAEYAALAGKVLTMAYQTVPKR